MILRPARSIVKANAIVLVAHLSRTFGSRKAVLASALAAVAGLAAINVVVYLFSASNLAAVFRDGATLGGAVVTARQVLVQSPGLTAAAVALVLVMFFPVESQVSLSARIAGASRTAIVLGDVAPVLGVIAVVATVIVPGSTLFVAQTTAAAPLAFIGLQALVLVDVVAVLLVYQFLFVVLKVLGAPDGVARIGGLMAGVGTIAVVLLNLLQSLLAGSPSWMSSFTELVWGSPDPTSLSATVTTVAMAGALFVCLFVVVAVTPQSRSLVSGARLFSIPLLGRPNHFANFVIREATLALRHPVSQLGLVSAVLLASVLAAGCRMGFVPFDSAVPGFAMLLSTGVESAFGRVAPWAWLVRQTGMGAGRFVAAQVTGSAIAGAVLFVVATAIASPTMAATSLAIPLGLVQLGMFSAVAYLSGVLAPYDRTAPLGMLITSVIAVVIDGGLFWLLNTVAPGDGPVLVACEFAAIAVTLGSCVVLVRARMSRAH